MLYCFDKNIYQDAHSKIFQFYNEKYKNRTTPLFEDGVICLDKYNGILFFLKEAYDKNCTELSRSLTADLLSSEPWGMWHHVAEWAYGLTHTTTNGIPRFKNLTCQEKRDAIDSIAVINIKKLDGNPTSNDDDITKHAEENKTSLLREIEVVQPRIIVCGGTMKYLEKILGTKRNHKCDNWYYWFNIGNLKDILVLDYCHPAFRSYSLLYYYGIVNIYQQALLSKDNPTNTQDLL